jgi:hypothetical protein
MSEATEQELKDMLSATVNISTDSLSIFLADAKAIVISHGISESNSKFSQLQRMMAAHLLSLEGRAGKAITEEQVNDVSISYADNPEALGRLYTTNWEKQYYKFKEATIGLTNRFL